jgi:hypothetical protein
MGGVCPGQTSVNMNIKMKKQKGSNRKKNALVFCRDRKQFWTTQKQFWQWVREGVVVKTGDLPLTGSFVREDEENLILVGHTVLNRECRGHLGEVLASRRMRIFKPRGFVRS